jgi:hypothetical protein
MFSYFLVAYLISILFYSLFILQIKRNIILIDLLFLFGFFMLVAFRPITLHDNSHYNDLFNFDINNFKYNEYIPFFLQELGFYYLTYIIKFYFTNSVEFYFVIITSINLINFYVGSRLILNMISNEQKNAVVESKCNLIKTKHFLIIPLFLFYLSNYGILYNFIVLRAGLALSFLYLAASLFIANKKLLAIVVLMFSLLFHQTAIIGILVLITNFFAGFKKKTYIIYLGIIFILYLFRVDKYFASIDLNSIFELSERKDENIYGSYISKEQSSSSYSIRILFLFVKLFIVVLVEFQSAILKRILNTVIFGLSLLVFGSSFLAFTRVADYFIIFSFPLFYLSIFQIKKVSDQNLFFIFFIVTEVFICLNSIAIFQFVY